MKPLSCQLKPSKLLSWSTNKTMPMNEANPLNPAAHLGNHWEKPVWAKTPGRSYRSRHFPEAVLEIGPGIGTRGRCLKERESAVWRLEDQVGCCLEPALGRMLSLTAWGNHQSSHSHSKSGCASWKLSLNINSVAPFKESLLYEASRLACRHLECPFPQLKSR